MRAPCTLFVFADGSFMYASPNYTVTGEGSPFTVRGAVADLTLRKQGEGKIPLVSHNKRLSEDVEVVSITRVPVKDLKVGDGDKAKDVIMERILIKVDGPRRWIKPGSAFGDFNPDTDSQTIIEVRRLVIANGGESKTWGQVIPVSEPMVVLGQIRKTDLTVSDFPKLDPQRRSQERLPWTDGKKQPRVMVWWLEDGLYAMQLPNLSSDDPAYFIGGLAQFDYLGKPGFETLVKGVEIHCVTFTTGAKGEKAFRLMCNGKPGIGVFVDQNCTEMLGQPDDHGTKCDSIHFGVLGDNENGWYPNPETMTYSSTRKPKRQHGHGTTKTQAGPELTTPTPPPGDTQPPETNPNTKVDGTNADGEQLQDDGNADATNDGTGTEGETPTTPPLEATATT